MNSICTYWIKLTHFLFSFFFVRLFFCSIRLPSLYESYMCACVVDMLDTQCKTITEVTIQISLLKIPQLHSVIQLAAKLCYMLWVCVCIFSLKCSFHHGMFCIIITLHGIWNENARVCDLFFSLYEWTTIIHFFHSASIPALIWFFFCKTKTY